MLSECEQREGTSPVQIVPPTGLEDAIDNERLVEGKLLRVWSCLLCIPLLIQRQNRNSCDNVLNNPLAVQWRPAELGEGRRHERKGIQQIKETQT